MRWQNFLDAVTAQSHFDYLVARYLPDQRGWKWSEARGLYL